MMKVVAALLIWTLLAGCAFVATPVVGGIYTDVKAPINAEGSGKVLKKGEACAQSILGLIATGDASIDAAKKAGGIEEVLMVDYSGTSVLGIYAKFCTIVRGR